MKVSDLMADLEKGDRTMEHLTAKTPEGSVPLWSNMTRMVGNSLGSIVYDESANWGQQARNQQNNLANYAQRAANQAEQGLANLLGPIIGTSLGGSVTW